MSQMLTSPAPLCPAVEKLGESLGGETPSLVRSGTARLYRAGRFAIRQDGPSAPLSSALHMVESARAAARAGVSAAEPVRVGKHWGLPDACGPVTMWHWVEHLGAEPTPSQVAFQLVALGSVAEESASLGSYDPFLFTRHQLDRIREERLLDHSELDLLERAHEHAARLYSDAAGPRGFTHGDLPGNLLVTGEAASASVVIDFETAGVGPRGWDLAKVVASAQLAQRPPEWVDAVLAHAAADGLRASPDELALARACVLVQGAAWVCSLRAEHRLYHAESLVRLASLQGRVAPWTPM